MCRRGCDTIRPRRPCDRLFIAGCITWQGRDDLGLKPGARWIVELRSLRGVWGDWLSWYLHKMKRLSVDQVNLAESVEGLIDDSDSGALDRKLLRLSEWMRQHATYPFLDRLVPCVR